MKHAGDLAAAAALAEEARCMDLADRYINSDCVKRMLQADQVLKLPFHLLLVEYVFFTCQFAVLCPAYICTILVMLYLNCYFEGGFGRKNCCIVHERWRSAQQPS